MVVSKLAPRTCGRCVGDGQQVDRPGHFGLERLHQTLAVDPLYHPSTVSERAPRSKSLPVSRPITVCVADVLCEREKHFRSPEGGKHCMDGSNLETLPYLA